MPAKTLFIFKWNNLTGKIYYLLAHSSKRFPSVKETIETSGCQASSNPGLDSFQNGNVLSAFP